MAKKKKPDGRAGGRAKMAGRRVPKAGRPVPKAGGLVKQRTRARKRPIRKKPETLRLRAVIPILTVRDVDRSFRFYTEALGFVVDSRWEEEGRLRGVAFKAGRCRFMINQDDFAKGRDRVKGVGHRLWLSTVQDLDALAGRAKACGVALDQEPTVMPWGARVMMVTDPDGFKLSLVNEE
jgi:uncharacterized glyoxalase superfamily protein PhnB